MMSILKKLGSVGFTAVISLALIILLIVSTSLEAVNGTPFAQKVFYQTRWFDLLVSFLWINIFCSTILRFPFKKAQIGFLITHIGILGLLTGAMISKTQGVDGEMTIFEGQTQDTFRHSGYDLGVRFPNQEETLFELKKGTYIFSLSPSRLNAAVPFCPLKKKTGKILPTAQGEETVSFNIVDILDQATQRMTVSEGQEHAPVNHAVQVKVKSKQMAHDAVIWLIEHDANDPSAQEAMSGPVRLTLSRQVKAGPSGKPVIKVFNKAGVEVVSIDIGEKTLPKNIPIAKTGFIIKDLEYYPYATVSGKNKLINYPEGKKSNPAVVFNLVDNKGVAVRKVKFAFFREFESMHPQGSNSADDVKITFEAGKPEDLQAGFEGLHLDFLYNDNTTWRFQAKFQDKVVTEGDVVAGKCYPSGWMDVEFCVQEALSRAQITYDIAEAKDGQGQSAAAVIIPPVSPTETHWVFEGQPTPVQLPKGQVQLVLNPKTSGMPFSLTLKQFRKIDYPGTQDPASFESDVVLTDKVRKISLERTISMNRPLEYEGFKVFQSSYFKDAQYGQASVFTVARNPGIPWIYLGSIFACLGALFQFYGTREKKA